METLSGADKIQALKEQKRLEREEKTRAEEERAKAAEADLVGSYESENESLGAMAARRDEINARLEAVKARRDEIIRAGHRAVEEARQDADVEAILHTKEGFDEVFAGEKSEWQALRAEVAELNEELEALLPAIAEKETRVAALYAETPAGKEALAEAARRAAEERRKELGARYVDPRHVDLADLARGEVSQSLFNARDIAALPEDERAEAVAAAKEAARASIVAAFERENERNGFKAISEDFARAAAFEKEKGEVIGALEHHRHYAQNLLERYREFFAANDGIDYVVRENLQAGNGDWRNERLVYCSYKISNADLFAAETALRSGDAEKGAPVPALQPLRDYMEAARIFNEGLLAALESGGVDKAKEIFWHSLDYETWAKKELGVDISKAAGAMVENQPKSLLASAASAEWKRTHNGNLKDHYDRETAKQAARTEAYAALAAADLDFRVANEAVGGSVKRMNLEDKKSKIGRDNEKANRYLPVLESAASLLSARVGENVSFDLKNSGSGWHFGVPKFADEIANIEKYDGQVAYYDARIKEAEEALRARRKVPQPKGKVVFHDPWKSVVALRRACASRGEFLSPAERFTYAQAAFHTAPLAYVDRLRNKYRVQMLGRKLAGVISEAVNAPFFSFPKGVRKGRMVHQM